MAVLVSEAIEDTLAHLLGSGDEQINRLSSAVSSTTSETLAMEFDLEFIQPGVVLGIDTEEILVLAVSESAKQVTACVRGYRGSTATTHDTGSLVVVDPRFSRARIMRVLKQEIDSLAPRLYRTTTVTINLAEATRGYNLASDVMHVISAKVEPITTYIPDSDSWPAAGFRLDRDLDSSDFASTTSIVFDRYLYEGSGRRVRVAYARKFDTSTFTTATDLVATVGMEESMTDIPGLGAAYRLLSTRGSQRTDFQPQGQSRRAEEVSVESILQASASLRAQRDQRVNEEMLKLAHRNGFHGGF